MKLPLIITLAFLPCLALAQSTTISAPTCSTNQPSSTEQKPLHHHLSPEKELAWLTTKLGLSDTQQGQIKPLLVSKTEKLKAIHEDTSLTEDQKHAQSKALIESTDQQIESFLTPAQVTQFEALHQDHAKPAQQ